MAPVVEKDYFRPAELHGGRMVLRAVTDINGNCLDPLQYWIQTGRWRKDYFEQDSPRGARHLAINCRGKSKLPNPYNNPEYEIRLERKGSYMREHDLKCYNAR